jgi:hypothetical protein
LNGGRIVLRGSREDHGGRQLEELEAKIKYKQFDAAECEQETAMTSVASGKAQVGKEARNALIADRMIVPASLMTQG